MKMYASHKRKELGAILLELKKTLKDELTSDMKSYDDAKRIEDERLIDEISKSIDKYNKNHNKSAR